MDNRKLIVAAGAIPLLMQLCRKRSEKVKKRSIRALKNLAVDNETKALFAAVAAGAAAGVGSSPEEKKQ